MTLQSRPPNQRAQLPAAPIHDLIDQARKYVDAATAPNTRRAYDSDWKHFLTWCRHHGTQPLPPNPETIGLYVTACASAPHGAANTVSTIERRLSSLSWHFLQRGHYFTRRADRHIATVLAGIRRTHGRPAIQKEATLTADLLSMLATLGLGNLRDIRDRAILLLGFAGGLRRSEIVKLDHARDQTADGAGWIEILPEGLLITLTGKNGWREKTIGPGSSAATCPVLALQTWLKLARITYGPLFRRVTAQGTNVGPDRLNDRHIARLVKRTALSAGLRPNLTPAQVEQKFAGHSLRAGLATSAIAHERHVQNQLGHATVQMTRRYQRDRDRFRVNLTKAAGL